jgi:PAS domain S-box-containing protein
MSLGKSANTGELLKADLLMAIDVFNDVIASASLADLAERICMQLRELSGARTAVLLQHDEYGRHAIAGISPKRRLPVFAGIDIGIFCPHYGECKQEVLTTLNVSSEMAAVFRELAIDSCIRFALAIEGKLIGAILLMNLPEMNRVGELLEIVHFLATPIALSLKNAIATQLIKIQAESLKALNEGLETKVAERTRELEQINRSLEAANNDALMMMRKAEEAKQQALATAAALKQEMLDRFQAHKELKNSEEKYRALFENSVEGILVIPHNSSCFSYANPAICRMLGYSDKELQQLGIADIHPQDELEHAQQEFLRMLKEEIVCTSSIRCIRRDRSIFYADIKASKANIDNTECIIGFFTDITDRYIAEKSLRENEQKFRAISEQIGDLILITDDAGMITYASPAANRIFHCSAEELLGLDISSLEDEASAASLNAFFTAVTRNRSEIVGQVVEFKRRDGHKFIAEISISLIITDQTQGYLIVIHDITERRLHEENLQRAAKLDSLGILAGGIAHDFNNLLGGIYGCIELALENVYEATAMRNLVTALGTIDRARALTQQLLTFSKGGSPLKKIQSISAFIKESVSFSLSGSNLAVTFAIDEHLHLCIFDRNQLGQVLDNIVINARQAMPDGGTLNVSAANVWLENNTHSLLAGGAYIKIAIADNGPGIPEELVSRVFDPFVTTKQMGNGLGLAVCYSIVKKHDGILEVDSQPGKGSCFSIFLPAVFEPDDSGTIVEVRGRHSGSGQLIVMDDEDVVRNIVAGLLGIMGYSAITLARGEEVLAYLESEAAATADLKAIILDLTVQGGMGGLDTMKLLEKSGNRLPVFVTSGYAEDPVMADPQKYGFIDSLRKPFCLDELSEIFSRHFKK